MYYVPDGTLVAGFYECKVCGYRYLSTTVAPTMICPECGEEPDMEIGPDDPMPEIKENAVLLEVLEGEEVERMDSLLSLAFTGGDFSWI